MPPNFRATTPDDAADLLRLWRDTWTATYGSSLGQSALSAMLKDLEHNGTASMLPGSGERGYCIASDHEIDGSAIFAERDGVAYLWGMYVHPSQQRRGLGSRLLHGVAGEIETAEKVEVRVLVSSPAAINFYRKHGFTETGREKTELINSVETATLVMCTSVENLKTTQQ
ncbi:GNAT family N-acetyltransferase [Rhizobium sp. P44RR-XXIV]|uniref:GNAT family N-acetyltransferase n=1 Tax=Rhizobium sp. P44RR-XXIV TaxID=1921145 RepID=UPI0009841022|nr:GNAT family N-acetyltransferase [Rhizobium sp. P44RR-XXIV]TIX90030.1 GNAT family N-acetyltransferase [Rhizobium sp. P44RR-XXIV]